ncbi:MAG: STAS domain-containing protein [Thermodesulfobacteriota bacterium]|nr:STAS domain-containing protein [Thermodesulfobacteriota bacterium]
MEPFSVFSLGEILLVSIEEEIDDSSVQVLLDKVSEIVSRQKSYGVIVDLQNLEVVDSFLADHLQQLARTLKLQDATMVIAGLAVPVVMILLDFGIKLPDLAFALDVEQALLRLQEKGGYKEDNNGPLQ